jgi:hypothetical protein
MMLAVQGTQVLPLPVLPMAGGPSQGNVRLVNYGTALRCQQDDIYSFSPGWINLSMCEPSFWHAARMICSAGLCGLGAAQGVVMHVLLAASESAEYAWDC